jgi:tetratricopeptide (TPR) repeat protein/predicted Ser/Thr protein kinase
MSPPCPDENVLLAYSQRRLPPDEARAVEAHLDGCSLCLALVGEAARGSEPTTLPERPLARPMATPAHVSGDVRRGAVLGRYVVIDKLGQGGMGVVLSAYDPELDRKVALKLVRSLQGDGAVELQQRLLREAQAVARLAHPHVITVFDVGTVDGRLFMAMEFIEGPTLRKWLARSRSWREVCAVFQQAGQGLAAAHAAGLVHRDFKPDNVLVDARGRVRVTDFGLARFEQASGPLLPSGEPAPAEGPHPGLTRTGSLVGTPAYMAPEQWHGHEVDARGDQFSFCVSLYEALYGHRPFARGSPPDFTRLPPPPPHTQVPAWVRRVVLRGLSVAPGERFPSMEALLEALSKDPARRTRRAVAAGLGALALTVAAVLVPWGGPSPCTGAPERLAPVWSEARRAAVRTALLATGSPRAQGTAASVEGLLAGYTRAWEDGYTETCRATHVRKEQPESVLALRMACLDRHLLALDALAGLLEHADAELVDGAVEAAQKLPRVSSCAHVDALLALPPPPEEPAQRARLESARRELARAQALLDTGRFDAGLPVAKAVLEEARALRYRPLEAEALHITGWLETRLGRNTAADELWSQAVLTALASRHDELALRSATELVYVNGYELGRYPKAREWEAQARALLERVGPREEVEAQLSSNAGLLAFSEGRMPEAQEHYQHALRLRERVLGPNHPQTAKVLNNLGLLHHRRGAPAEAVPLYERVLAIQREQLGPDHPVQAVTLINLGDSRRALEGPDAALPFYTQALELRLRTVGETHPLTLRLYNDIGRVHMQRGDFVEARKAHERALALCARAYGEEHAEYALALKEVAALEHRQGRMAEALALYDRVLALQERLLGTAASVTMRTREERAGVLLGSGRAREALGELEGVLSRREADGGPRQGRLVPTLLELGRAHLALGQPQRARAVLERGLDIARPLGWSAVRLAELEFELARALWDSGAPREQALALAGTALAAFEAAGPNQQAKARAVAQWRDSHGRHATPVGFSR